MVSLPTRGTNLRLTASSATRRTVQRARPSGGLLHTIAIKRCFWLSSSTSAAPGLCLLVQRPLQTALLVTTADIAYGLGSERDHVGDLRCAGALGQLQQSQGTQDDPNLLDAAAQQLGKLSLILRRDIDAQRWTTHTSSMRQNNST